MLFTLYLSLANFPLWKLWVFSLSRESPDKLKFLGFFSFLAIFADITTFSKTVVSVFSLKILGCSLRSKAI